MPSFAENYKGFVLKLEVEHADGSTQIRRVRLPRIANEEGGVSYEELAGLAIKFVFPKDPDGATTSREDYSVSLTYQDVDADIVTIASDEELVDAIEQYADKNVLRITAVIQRCFPSVPGHVANEVPKTVTSTDVPSNVASSDSSKECQSAPEANAEAQMERVLESFSAVLSNAVAGFEKGLSEPAKDASKDAAERAREIKRTAKAASRDVAKKAKDVAKSAKAASKDVSRMARRISKAASKAASDVSHSFSEVKSPPQACSSENKDSEDRTESEFSNDAGVEEGEVDDSKQAVHQPFIHGRHTCDSCLTTPIVGYRYHATNLKDYDLCEKCYCNYKGDEIKFETVELDRDRVLQQRWNHRRSMIAMRAGRRGPCGRRGPRGRGRWSGPHGNTWSSTYGHPHPHNHSVAVHPHVHYHSHQDVPVKSSESRSDDFDAVLKEAIRRSLEESRPKDDSIHSGPSVEPNVDASAKASENQEGEVAAKPEEGKSARSESDEVLNLSEIEEPEIVVEPTAPLEDTVIDEPRLKESKTTPIDQDESFEANASGFGDTAEAIGATLDIVAGVINEMLADTATPSKQDLPEAPSMASNASTAASVPEEACGTTIVDSVDAPSVDDAASSLEDAEKEWQVVSGDVSETNEESLDEDQDIARAAEMLGSALYNSDMQEEACGSDTSSVSMSSTVPSVVPSLGPSVVVNDLQRERFAPQLSQLREIGFFDEAKCIDVIERLNAANIGVDSNDEVTVEQIINEMFKQNK